MGMPVITPSNISRCQSVSDIIQSVALEQAALSHILNAEGEKIQRIVADADSPQEMLAVNESVNDVVNSITMLEIVLKSKLTLFEDCLCEECLCTPVTETALNLTGSGEDAEIVRTNRNRYTTFIDGSSALPVSMLFATTPSVFVKAVSLPSGVSFQNNTITVTDTRADNREVVLEAGEGVCRQTITVGINFRA